MKENLPFKKLQSSYINSQKKTKKHLKLIINTLSVDEVAKTDDEIYVLSIIKYIVTFLFFSVLCQRRWSC